FRQLVLENMHLNTTGSTVKATIFILDGSSPMLDKKPTAETVVSTTSGDTRTRTKLSYTDFSVEEKKTSADTSIKIKPEDSPTIETRRDILQEKIEHLVSSKAVMDRELADLKSIPAPLAVLVLPGLRPISATCRLCHHPGHKESGNKGKRECCYEKCPGYMYCGKLDRHREHAELVKEKVKDIKYLKDQIKDTEAELYNIKIFIDKNQTQFARVVKPRLKKLYPEK
ncbi:uncharacterized protein LOC144357073, partial [Saccoglossus kowalevskii]